jgi:voltage-gated potassium channel Kch
MAEWVRHVDDNGAMTEKTDLAKDPDFQRHTYKKLAAGAVFLIASGTVIFSLLEDWSVVDSFYFCVVTVTTVGFGDITPDTDAAKLATVVYIIVGISIISTFLDARLKKHAYDRSGRVQDRLES